MFVLKYVLLLLQAFIVLAKDAGPPSNHISEVVANLPTDLTTTKIVVNPTTKPDDVTPPKTTTTEAPTTTTTTTPEPTPPTTTTAKPTTSTSTSPPSTTSVTPSTSTTAVPTTVAPLPDHWVVTSNGTVCILAKMDIKLDLKLSPTAKDISMTVPKEASVNGTCGEDKQYMVLTWNNNSLSLHFKSNETSKTYHLDSVVVEIDTANETVQLSHGNITLFETALNHSYSCSYSDPLKFTINNETIQFSFSNIELEAFKKGNSTKFSNVSACPPETPDIVPIVVGCALTVLVVVVLIAYLYGRRRTQARGYLSM